MKLKQHWTYLLIMLSAIVILLSGCEKKEAVDLYTRHVEVVFSPNGIGDQGYNDNILAGLQQASVKYGFVLGIHFAENTVGMLLSARNFTRNSAILYPCFKACHNSRNKVFPLFLFYSNALFNFVICYRVKIL